MLETQIFDMINVGIVVLDPDYSVRRWNRWMSQQSGIAADSISGSSIFEYFPDLDTPKFRRNCKAVLRFGSFSFFSQKLHGHLFPFAPPVHLQMEVDFMQQSCTVGPIYDEDRLISNLFISVEDVTESVVYQNRLAEMNRRDGLTGLFNRRYLADQLTREFERARRYRRSLTLMMLDIDNFKTINDTFGHPFGDEVIRAVANLMVGEVRTVDVAARYGGEEFCCLLPETGVGSAVVLAERIRQKVCDLQLTFEGQRVPVTVSVGLSEIVRGVGDYATLLRLADEALYQAKTEGRNRVRCSG